MRRTHPRVLGHARSYLPGMADNDTAAPFLLALPGRVQFRCRIPRSSEITGFAPATGVCTSRAGRIRERHEWDSDGAVCCFCDARSES